MEEQQQRYVRSFPKIISGRNGGAAQRRFARELQQDFRNDVCEFESVSRIGRKNLPQVRFAKDQHSIQALSACSANQTLHVGILTWRSWRDHLSIGAVIVAHLCSIPRPIPLRIRLHALRFCA